MPRQPYKPPEHSRPDAGRSPGRPLNSRLRLRPFTPEEFESKRRVWTKKSREALPGLTKAYAMIALGCIIMAAGYSFFMIPQRIAPGGVYGIATVLHYASKGLVGVALPTGTLGLILNIPLFFWGLKALGGRFVTRTLFGMIMASVAMDILSLQIQRLGWTDAVTALDPMLASLFGGVCIGLGLGLIFRKMGSTGGTDVVGQILGTHTNISVGVWMMIVDAAVVVLAAYYFKSLNLSLYAVVAIFVTGKVIDSVLEGRSHSRAVTIITEKDEPIREAILFGLNRTGTLFQAQGLYQGQAKNVFLCVVNRKHLKHLETMVAQADPAAFLVVHEAHEVLGEGFVPLKDRLGSERGISGI